MYGKAKDNQRAHPGITNEKEKEKKRDGGGACYCKLFSRALRVQEFYN